MANEYDWNDLFRDFEVLNAWANKKPKWWQFWKHRSWKRNDPRKYWRC